MVSTDYQFKGLIHQTYAAAQKIVPIITNIVGIPESIVDLGGGGGGWLKAFKEVGTKNVCCIDHPSIDLQDLLISKDEFSPFDLSKKIPSPFQCDLAISTEFAEHVESSQSQEIVNFLTKSAPVILFSAAIPGQGGLGHINEKRPNFWKKLYEEKGYIMIDAIRPKIILDETIPFWFRQNLYLYIDKNIIDKINLPPQSRFLPDDFEIVHTSTFENFKISDLVKKIMPAVSRAVKYRVDSLKQRFPL